MVSRKQFNKAMTALAKKIGLEYWRFDGSFLAEVYPDEKSIVSRLERLELGCTCGAPRRAYFHYPSCALKATKQVNVSQEDFNLLLGHLNLMIVDGKRIVSTKPTPKPKKKVAKRAKK